MYYNEGLHDPVYPNLAGGFSGVMLDLSLRIIKLEPQHQYGTKNLYVAPKPFPLKCAKGFGDLPKP